MNLFIHSVSHSNFPVVGYDIGEKICHPRRMLEKIHSIISFCCRCVRECSCSKWLTENIFNPISYYISAVISFCCRCVPACSCSKLLTRYILSPICYCASVFKAIMWTIIVCALDYSDLTKDLGFIVALEYISDAIVVSLIYLP